ncbi:MAG TPA: hypothetical protein VK094_00135 [Pseudogracilibacillus sp.]|nr:hypothetical protein [Pseudogracilibacillus sp.]
MLDKIDQLVKLQRELEDEISALDIDGTRYNNVIYVQIHEVEKFAELSKDYKVTHYDDKSDYLPYELIFDIETETNYQFFIRLSEKEYLTYLEHKKSRAGSTTT